MAGRRSVTADTDLRLCRYFGLSDGWWLRGQSRIQQAASLGCRSSRTPKHRATDLPSRRVGAAVAEDRPAPSSRFAAFNNDGVPGAVLKLDQPNIGNLTVKWRAH